MDFLTVNCGGNGTTVEVIKKMELCTRSRGKRSDPEVPRRREEDEAMRE